MRLPSSHINYEKHCNSQIKSRTIKRPFAYKQWSKDVIHFASGESEGNHKICIHSARSPKFEPRTLKYKSRQLSLHHLCRGIFRSPFPLLIITLHPAEEGKDWTSGVTVLRVCLSIYLPVFVAAFEQFKYLNESCYAHNVIAGNPKCPVV
jgi:hypothetical protein